MRFHQARRLAGYVLTCSILLLTVGAWGQSNNNVRLSVDVGMSTFLDDWQFVDLVGTLESPEVSGWFYSETVSTPHLGVNVHLGENWVFGANYQAKKKSSIDIHRNTTPRIDTLNSNTTWLSVFAERQLISNSRHAWHATGGISRAITKFSGRLSGANASTRNIEVDPIIGTGYTVKWANWSMRLTATRRFADDDATEFLALTFRFGS